MKKGYYIWATAAGYSLGYFYHDEHHPLSLRGMAVVQQQIASHVAVNVGGLLIPVKAVALQYVTELPPEVSAERWITDTTDTTPNTPTTALPLDNYEAANLKAGLLTLRAMGCDTGDWLGQILNRIPETDTIPNTVPGDQVARAKLQLKLMEESK